MSDLKQVKVDNWGIYFLQRLKHFFNRTDYCDLTLQFQDNAQLKVHRLVLNACTEYFELLERTCEMYEDCLVMPDDLQADVVVPIVNFMYTGQLEFRMDSLEKLYQTSLVMSMPVLSKLLEAHRNMHLKTSSHNLSSMKKATKLAESAKPAKYSLPSTSLGKRSFNKAFESNKSFTSQKSQDSNKTIAITSNKIPEVAKNKQVQNAEKHVIYREKKYHFPAKTQTLSTKKPDPIITKRNFRAPSPIPLDPDLYTKKFILGEPRPTRYELPEELDTDNLFENSFSSISYSSAPLVVHPDSTSKYLSKKNSLFNEALSSKRSGRGSSTVDIVECKKISRNDNLFEDDVIHTNAEDEIFQPAYLSVKDESQKDSSQLFDQILDGNEGTKVTIEAKDKQTGNLDHAKIISEVLKKYPHLVKSNKNIKLKILNTPTKSTRKPRPVTSHMEEAQVEPKPELSYTYETDVLDSQKAATLIAMGAENIKGPWICLICGTPGRALNFTSYYNFRKHLVEIHREKPVSTICEYCGLKSLKRNYLMHHIYTKHGVPPPPQYHFPKCNMCDYIALTEGFLVKHKLTHSDTKTVRCGICSAAFSSSSQLFVHMHKTGHRVGSDKKSNLQCIYCMKVFLRESNFYVHLKMNHRDLATRDGIIEDSDDEKQTAEKQRSSIHEILKQNIKYEHAGFQNDYEETEQIQYQIQQRSDGNLHFKKPRTSTPGTKHKILNPGFTASSSKPAPKASDVNNEYLQDMDSSQETEENIILIDDNEYIMKDNQLIPRKHNKSGGSEYIISDYIETENQPAKLQNIQAASTATLEISSNIHNAENVHQSKMIVKKSASMNQPIQIVVSNEEEYKALMSSNHSIIFDDGEANKTLTVLTAPHGTSLDNAAIDLENTESNDMMIIQDDYQINATETVSGDSKFVVVYSHAMTNNDHNKQYQIITPHEIGGQFVQSTEVITQNYETVTTSAPIMNAHVIDAQIPESWQGNVTPNIENQPMQIGSETEIQPIQVGSETEIQPLQVGPETEIQPMHIGSETEIQPNQVCPETEILPIQVGSETEIVPIPVDSETNIQPMQVGPETEIQTVQVGSETEIPPMQVGSETEIITMANSKDNAKITESGNDMDDPHNSLIELPEVQLAHKPSETIPPMYSSLPQIENNDSVVGTENISDNITEQVIVKELQNSTQEPMDIGHIPTEEIPEKEPSEDSQITYQQEVNIEDCTSEHNTNKENMIVIQPQPELPVEEPIVEDTGKIINTTKSVMDVCTDNVITEQTLTNNDEGKEPDHLVQLPIYNESSAPLDNENNLPAKVAIEQVQKIASEWSEDEDEAVVNKATETKEANINAETDIEATVSKEPELEETIENIEQEMQKQISNTTERDSINEESSNSFQEATVASPKDLTPLPAGTIVNTEATQEKISSLLNDWDDNDSQEEKVNENGEPDAVLTVDPAEENNIEKQITNKPNPKADDNIKSLVSDWDDEDEENK